MMVREWFGEVQWELRAGRARNGNAQPASHTSGRANGRATQHYCPVSGHAQASSFFGVAQQ